MSRTHLTQQQIDSLAASFLPAIKKFFQSEEGKAMYQKYLDEKAELAKSAESEKDNNDNDAVKKV